MIKGYSNEKFKSKYLKDGFGDSYTPEYRSRSSRKRKKGDRLIKTVGIIAIAVIVISIGIFAAIKIIKNSNYKKEDENLNSAQMKQDIYVDFKILGIAKPFSLKGLTKQDVYDKILSSYAFDIKIFNSNPEIEIFEMPKYGADNLEVDYEKYMEDKGTDTLGTSQELEVENPLSDITIKADKTSFSLPNFVDGQAKNFIDDIYDKYLHTKNNEFNKKKVNVDAADFKADFVFNVTSNDNFLDDSLSQIARLWDTKASKGQIESFDQTKNEFVFGDDHKGYIIDQDELRKKILESVNSGKLKNEFWTILKTVDAEDASVKSRYKYVSVFETWTTDNEKRNNNIALACKSLNGTIVKPGQEFSFNNKLGERTEEKGYDFAPAYLEGQVVEELGGGVCQVSTTLYNAVFGAGLTTTYRKSHTFEPAYITPGLDATVSFRGPDYKFLNTSDYSVGIRASYVKNKVKIEIFAVPILKKGEEQHLVSKKIQDLDYPSLSIIDEGKASKGTKGSEWQVFKVVKSGDTEIERVHDHYTKYQGHTPTAFEENTYVDDDGVLQTSKFVATRKGNPSGTKSTNHIGETIEPSEG